MNFFNESNNLNTPNNKAWTSVSGKKGLSRSTFIKTEDCKRPGQDWSFLPVETSPIVCAPAIKAGPKRKKRQNWSKPEDDILVELVGNVTESHELKWPHIAHQINKTFDSIRTGKQCRERWLNHLRPNIKKGQWTVDEEFMIEYFYKTFGPKWSTMAKLMKNRTDNDIKNKWNSMKRSEKAARKRKNAPTQDPPIKLTEDFEAHKAHEVVSSQWSAMEETTALEMQRITTGKSSDWKCAGEAAILPTVTDGGSTENSPVSTKKYWNYEV